jgi:hypothetical protein
MISTCSNICQSEHLCIDENQVVARKRQFAVAFGSAGDNDENDESLSLSLACSSKPVVVELRESKSRRFFVEVCSNRNVQNFNSFTATQRIGGEICTTCAENNKQTYRNRKAQCCVWNYVVIYSARSCVLKNCHCKQNITKKKKKNNAHYICFCYIAQQKPPRIIIDHSSTFRQH